MEVKSRFQRSFLIFENEDPGYEAGQKPSGYIKLEMRDGKGRLWLSVQNLREQKDRFSYELYLMRTGGRGFVLARAGTLAGGNNGHSLEWAFDPSNVAGTGMKAAEIDTAAVVVSFRDRAGGTVNCPLAAYRDSKTEWRQKAYEKLRAPMERTLSRPMERVIEKPAGKLAEKPIEKPMERSVERPAEKLQGLASKVPDRHEIKIESKYIPRETLPSFNMDEVSMRKFAETVGQPLVYGAGKPETGPEQGVRPEPWPEVKPGPAQAVQLEVQIEAEPEIEHETETEEEKTSEMEREIPLETELQTDEVSSNLEQEPGTERDEPAGEERTEEGPGPEQTGADEGNAYGEGEFPAPMDNDTPPSMDNNTPPNCMYMNGGMQARGGQASPCSACKAACSHSGAQTEQEAKPGDIARLKGVLERNFEKIDPFNSNRSDYIWWKASSPVTLNNMLYECGIRSPLLFNPAVMMSHYKYRHLIVGIFTDRQFSKEYLVCGVPAMHMVDKKPFDVMCRWVQLEGSRPLYGAFGYWLVYIDPETGRLLNIR